MSAITDRFEDTHPHRWLWRIGYVVVVSPLACGLVWLITRGLSQ